MYRTADHQMSIYDYLPPYHGELAEKNRWVRLTEDMDWDTFEMAYRENFSSGGKVAIPARVALGSLIIQRVYGVSDRTTVELVRESPYLQYFLGCDTFSNKVPFSSKSLPRFRRRIPSEMVQNAVRLLKSYC